MSVRAGRWYLLVASAVLAAGVVWLALVVRLLDPASPAIAAPAVLVLLATVALAVGALLMPRFVEATVDGRNVTIRFVLGRTRVVPVSEIDEVVVVQHLILPTRTGPTSSARVILRQRDETLTAFTPREGSVAESLHTLGCRVTLIREPLTPVQLRRRYRHGVGVGELLIGASGWLALLVGVVVLVWVLAEAARG